MAEQQFQPLWTKEQLKQFTTLYEGRGHLLSPENKQKIEQHSAYYNVPFYEGEGSIIKGIKAAGAGIVDALTLNLFASHEPPKSQSEAIAKNIGHLIGFAPSIMSAPLRALAGASRSRGLAKAAGYIAKQGNKISPSMIIADKATKVADKAANVGLNLVNAEKISTLTGAKKLLLGGPARSIARQSFHLGVASAAGTLPDIIQGNINSTWEAFKGGATAGAAFGVIGETIGPMSHASLKKLFDNPKTAAQGSTALKAISGSLVQGNMAAGHGATNPELVYEYLLGAYFGGHAGTWYKTRAQKLANEIDSQKSGTESQRKEYNEWAKQTGKDLQAHSKVRDEPIEVREALKDLQAMPDFGDPYDNLTGNYKDQLKKEAGLKDVQVTPIEKTPEGFVDKGEYVAGRKVVTVTESALKKDNYIATTGTKGDAVLSNIAGKYGLPSFNYVPRRPPKEIRAGLDRPLSEDQIQEANKHISKASKSLSEVVEQPDGTTKTIPLPLANIDPYKRTLISKNYWAVKNAKEVYLVTELRGDTGNKIVTDSIQKWPAQMAKDLGKDLFVLDSSTNRWHEWNKLSRRFVPLADNASPKKPSDSIALLGGDRATQSRAIRQSIDTWLSSHYKKNPIAGEVARRTRRVQADLIKETQQLNAQKEGIQKVLKDLSQVEQTDDIIAQVKGLESTLDKTNKALELIESQTTKTFIEEAIQEEAKTNEVIAEKLDFDTEITDKEIYKTSIYLSDKYFEEFWGARAGIETSYNQHIKKIEISQAIDDIIYKKHAERGSKKNRSEDATKDIEDYINDKDSQFDKTDFKLPEQARGDIRQAISRYNLGAPVYHLASDGITYYKIPGNNQVSRGGTRKNQLEPEKYIESTYKNAAEAAGLEVKEPFMFTLDHVTRFNKDRGFNVDMELSRFRQQADPAEYRTFIKNVAEKADKEGMYIFGGASDKDRLYFIKYHPQASETVQKNTQLFFNQLSKQGLFTKEDLTLSRKQSAQDGMTRSQHDKALISNILYDLSMNGQTIYDIPKFLKSDAQFVKGSAGFNKRAQIWFTNSYPADAEFIKSNYINDAGQSLLNKNGKYNTIMVNDLPEHIRNKMDKKHPDYDKDFTFAKNSLDNIENPENVDGAIIVPDNLLNVINKDFGVPKSGQNKSFIISPDREHGTLLGKYMMHGAGPELSKMMESQGLHMIMQETAVKQRGTREIGDYFIKDGELDIQAKTYEISPEDVKGSYGVYGNDHFFDTQRLPKQVMLNMLESSFNPMSQDVINESFDKIIGNRWNGEPEFQNKLKNYLEDSAEGIEPSSRIPNLIKNIEKIPVFDLVEAVRSESSPQLAEALYQKMLKVNKENVAIEHRDGDINSGQYKEYLTELNEFNSITDRLIKNATAIAEEARSAGSNITADSIYNHKFIRDFKARAVQSFLINTAAKPFMGNSGAAYMRPYDKAMRINLDKANELLDLNHLNGINKNDEIFFLDNFHKKVKIYLNDARGSEYKSTLGEVFSDYSKLQSKKRNKADNERLAYLEEVLTAATVRVPMDSVSGMRILKFGGFTGRDGHGILLHSKAMRAEGGADLDGDKAFYYFGGTRGMSKDMMQEFHKNKKEFEYTDAKGEIYTKDNKEALINQDITIAGVKYKKGTPVRELLIARAETEQDKNKMALAESSLSHYAPSERIRISSAAVDGRNQLGPAVSNSQLMKGAFNSIVASGGTDVLNFKDIYLGDIGVTIKAKNDKDSVLLQRDISRAQLGLASDPMDELGLSSIKSWKKILWDSYFEVIDAKTKDGKRVPKAELAALKERLSQVDELDFSYTNSGLFGDFVNLNKGLWGRNYTENRAFDMYEIQDLLSSSMNILERKGASNSFLPKIGNLFVNLDWSDSPFTRLNKQKLLYSYIQTNNKLKARKPLQELLGRSSMKVPYTEQISNILETKYNDRVYSIYRPSDRVDAAGSVDVFNRIIKGTRYSDRAKGIEGISDNTTDGFHLRLKMLNKMVKQGEDFIVNDITDMITLNLIDDIMKTSNISPKRFQAISEMVDYLKKNSYLMMRDRQNLEARLSSIKDKRIREIFKGATDEIFKGGKEVKPGEDPIRTSEMDQVAIDQQIKQFRKKAGLNKAENMLFDQLMLGSITRGTKLDKIEAFESEAKRTKNKIALDYIKNLRNLNSKTNLGRLGFSSSAINDSSVRLHLRRYMEMMNENYIPLNKTELASLDKALGNIIDTPPSMPNVISKMATNTGFEGIDTKARPTKNKELASLVSETAVLLKNHPDIVKKKSGEDLNEFIRGLPFIRKDFDAMSIADVYKLNAYLKQVKEGTIWQRIKDTFGKDKKALSFRHYQQLPSTVSRELEATEINLIRKEGYFTDAKGELQFGKIKVPTQFIDTLTNSIGRMTEMGTQVGDKLVSRFQESQLFYQGVEDAARLWEVAIRQREYDGRHELRSIREKLGKDPKATERSIKYMEQNLKDAKKAIDWTKTQNKKYLVNLPEGRVERTGKQIIDRINKNLTEYMEEMHTIIRGREEFRGEQSPYFIEWYDKEQLSPKYNHTAFLKDLDTYLNGRVPLRWRKVMKSTNESIPSIFGIDGVRAMMREMHIEFLMEIGRNKGGKVGKKFIEKARELSDYPVKETGKLSFESYFPRMFFEPGVVKKGLKAATQEIINDKTLTSEARIDKLVKIQNKYKRLDGDYFFEEMEDGPLYDSLTKALHAKEEVSSERMKNWFSLDASTGNMRSREHSTEGWSVAPTSVEAYVRSLSNTYFKGLAGMISRNIVSNPETGVYKKLVNKWGVENAEAWTEYAKLYVNDALGNPVTISEKMMNDPKMALKYSPYARWADNRVADKLSKWSAKLGIKGVVDKDGQILGGVNEYDVKRLSQMEARFQMASLLAHPKSMAANLMGGTLHTLQSSGLSAFRNVFNYEYLQNINPKLKSRSDVEDMVMDHGVLPQWMIYELGLQKEFQTNQGKESLKVISDFIKRNPNAKPKELTEYLKSIGSGISEKTSNFAAKFMTVPERKLRTDAFMAHYIKAWESFGGAIKDPNHPFLIEMAKKGVEATQFLYSAPYRPAYARTSLGKVMTRFQMYAWNSVKLRGDVMRRLEVAGYKPNSPEGREATRFIMGDMFMLSLANIFAYSLFENNLPQPYGWFQDTADWIFGDEKERDKAFFGTYPTAIAPLQAITPPIGRVGLIISNILNGDMERVTDYYIHTMYPFGRMGRDIYGKGGILEAPIRLVDKLTGIPLTQIQRKTKRMREQESEFLYPKAFTGGY